MKYATADLPGAAATLGSEPEDFAVEEVPLYEPSGDGPHTYLTVEKRNLTTFDAVNHLARALGVPARDIGTAGLKDRRAVTRQRISVPGVDPERAAGLTFALPPGQELRVLEARRHGNKLKTGHLSGNRFRLRLRADDPAAAAAAARAILDRLAEVGIPNYYGEQRFGSRGDNAERGRALLAGKGGGHPREKRLYISALQSHLFNRVLDARLDLGPPRTVLAGDVLVRPGSHATFLAPDPPTVEQTRADAGEIVPTGPMFGPRMTAPAPGSPAARLEEAILAEEHLTVADLGRAGRLAEGTRREIAIAVTGITVDLESSPGTHTQGHVVVSFGLPRGAYATVLLAELTKPQTPIAFPAEPPAEVP
jgi:tRNA pseudouridine13 synthase